METEATIKNENDRSRKRPATQEEREIDEWAKKLITRPIPQIPIPGQGGGQNQPDIAQHSGFDIDSAIGRFTWHTIGQDKYIPCLFRSKEKFCCVRMVEASIMGDLLNVLPQEIYDSAKLCSHFVSVAQVTQAEAKLLSYINSWHSDGFYGTQPFAEKDLVVRVGEVEEFYSYLMFAYNVLASGGQNKDNDFSRCGFVRVNNESLIPYTVLRSEDEKGVPLFYFEGQTDILKVKAKPLSGWDLAYLKVCCKVQGVRKELIAGDTLNIVKLSDLKSYFPKRTVFTEKCWPPSKGKSLLPKQNLNGLPNPATVQTQVQNTASAQIVRQQQQQLHHHQQQHVVLVGQHNRQPLSNNVNKGSAGTTQVHQVIVRQHQQQQQQQQQPQHVLLVQGHQRPTLNNHSKNMASAQVIVRQQQQQQQQRVTLGHRPPLNQSMATTMSTTTPTTLVRGPTFNNGSANVNTRNEMYTYY